MEQNKFSPKVGDVIVCEIINGVIGKQISMPLNNAEEANSFIITMKKGMYYKSKPDIQLIAIGIINIV